MIRHIFLVSVCVVVDNVLKGFTDFFFVCYVFPYNDSFASVTEIYDCFHYFFFQYFLPNLGSKTGQFSKVKVSNCDESSNVCVLKRNTNATIELDFKLSKLKREKTI